MNPKPTTRSYRACTWCRSHKRKCDGLEPCTSCVNSNDGRQCVYAAPKKRGRKIKRQYDDNLSIDHVVRRRPDATTSPVVEPESIQITNSQSSPAVYRMERRDNNPQSSTQWNHNNSEDYPWSYQYYPYGAYSAPTNLTNSLHYGGIGYSPDPESRLAHLPEDAGTTFLDNFTNTEESSPPERNDFISRHNIPSEEFGREALYTKNPFPRHTYLQDRQFPSSEVPENPGQQVNSEIWTDTEPSSEADMFSHYRNSEPDQDEQKLPFLQEVLHNFQSGSNI